MHAGALKERVVIEERTTAQDEFGQPVETWLPWATVYASIEPLSGREFFAAQQANAEITARIRIRYQPEVNARMRIVHAGRIYNIRAVIDPGMRHEELELMCSEGVNDGG
jgi:SPP1 family predicted phage head-tail adaptor